jgi:hypothetical protein
LFIAFVVQWIEQSSSKALMQVRFLPKAQLLVNQKIYGKRKQFKEKGNEEAEAS